MPAPDAGSRRRPVPDDPRAGGRLALRCAVVIDLSDLYRRLERATFSRRAELAAEVAAAAGPTELDGLARGLAHPHPAVRLGVIEVLRLAGHRGAVGALLAHARAHQGDDRVFALRALADLAQPGDATLLEAARGWLATSDPFVAAQAARLVAAVSATPAATASPGRGPAPTAAAMLERMIVAAFAATTTTDRLARVAELEASGPLALAGAARLVLKRGDADLVAYVARALIRQAPGLATPEALVPLLEAARARVGGAPATDAAIDDAVRALAGPTSPAVLARVGELDDAQRDDLVARLCARPPEEAARAIPALLAALGRAPERWSSLGPALAHGAAHVRPGTRAELRQAGERVIDQLRAGEPVPAATVVAVTWVLARVSEPGEPLPTQLAHALDRVGTAAAARALAALCVRLATEAAAATLVAMARDPLPAARAAAAAGIGGWQSPWIDLTGEPPALTSHYHDGDGRPLLRQGARLVVGGSHDDHVLDERGRPVTAATTEHGGCLCCAPPRALVRRRRARLRCPASWVPHLRDGGRVLREADHPLGGCRRCDSVRPRVQDGPRAICLDCGAGLPAADRAPAGSAELPPLIPSEDGRTDDDQALPRPPSPDELALVPTPIRTAIAANVFLRAGDGFDGWSGSGIVIARDGDHVAILTNRHVVETDDGHRLVRLSAMTIAGELTSVRCVWRAGRGVDLAVVEGRVPGGAELATMPVTTTPIHIGARVFAIGNPLGLAWTYSAGTLSASRQWMTQDGLGVRVLQTDTAIGPGSSGGGLFHEDGRLLGVISFARRGAAGGSAHFALGLEAVHEAFVREAVTWRGIALAGL